MIGGKVLDASALAALVRGRIAAMAWFDTAGVLSLPLYLPALALTEVRAVRRTPVFTSPRSWVTPSVILGELDAATTSQGGQLLLAADVFDGGAGHGVHTAQTWLARAERRPRPPASR